MSQEVQRDRQSTPFTTFNFEVIFTLDDEKLCGAAFAECDGLEMTMEPKTYQEGGNNLAQIHLVGPVTYGQLTLKRGMTRSLDLWKWFDRVLQGEGDLRVNGLIVMYDSRGISAEEDEADAAATFYLSRCLPVKIRAPGLNAADGGIAIEEMQVVYERLRMVYPEE